MPTIAGLAERLDMSAKEAFETLRALHFEVESIEAEISDKQADILIEVDEDRAAFDRYLKDILKREAQNKKRAENLQKAAKKAAEKRKAKAKPKAKKKAAAAETEAETEPAQAESGEAEVEAADEAAVTAAEAPVVEAEMPEAEILPAAPPEEERAATAREKVSAGKSDEKEAGPAVVIGSAIDHDARHVAVLRADGTPVDVPEAEILEAVPEAEVLEAETEEDTAQRAPGLLAEAERRQEEEEKRRARRRPVPAAAPDPEVVAEVIRRDRERGRRKETARVQAVPDFPDTEAPAKKRGKATAGSKTGKTARKRQKRAERQRVEDGLRRDAAQLVREFQAGGFDTPRRKKRRKAREEGAPLHEEDTVRILEVRGSMTVEELSNATDLTVNDIILELMDDNILATKNHSLDLEVIRRIVEKHDYEVRAVIPEEEELMAEEEDSPESLRPRAPVITVMGHVDHGKTSFLDVVRQANVAEGEAGGITQHIAAYDVYTSSGRLVFLDTPGHEAFTQMRARGASITDIVVLVVAADDGVRPQTIEAINHARAAEVPIVVAINKIDKPEAQPERVRQELSHHQLIDSSWGGETMMKEISAKTHEGIEDLLELLVLQAESMELKANPDKRARGAVVESEMTVGQGPVAWVLVQSGTLRPGDSFLCGETYGRVRTLTSSQGRMVQEAGPATPVLVTGFNEVPQAGDVLVAVADERSARSVSEQRTSLRRQAQAGAPKAITLEDFQRLMQEGEQKMLNVIVKADVQGSVDAIQSSLLKLGNEEVRINVLHSGVGGVNESDVLLASTSQAVIIGFHVTAAARVKRMAEMQGVEIRTYRVIYEALDDVSKALEGMLAPEKRESVTGHAEIRQVFRSSALGNIAGCYVTDGEISRTSLVRLTRDDVVVYEGKIASLRRAKDDARTVSSGYECGITIAGYDDIKEGDIIEAYQVEEVAKTFN